MTDEQTDDAPVRANEDRIGRVRRKTPGDALNPCLEISYLLASRESEFRTEFDPSVNVVGKTLEYLFKGHALPPAEINFSEIRIEDKLHPGTFGKDRRSFSAALHRTRYAHIRRTALQERLCRLYLLSAVRTHGDVGAPDVPVKVLLTNLPVSHKQ